jgi:hypothetical protein
LNELVSRKIRLKIVCQLKRNDGWVGGWLEVKAVLWIAYSNQKVN